MLEVLRTFPFSPVIIVLSVGQSCEHLGIQLSRVLVPLLLGVRLEKEELDYLIKIEGNHDTFSIILCLIP